MKEKEIMLIELDTCASKTSACAVVYHEVVCVFENFYTVLEDKDVVRELNLVFKIHYV